MVVLENSLCLGMPDFKSHEVQKDNSEPLRKYCAAWSLLKGSLGTSNLGKNHEGNLSNSWGELVETTVVEVTWSEDTFFSKGHEIRGSKAQAHMRLVHI